MDFFEESPNGYELTKRAPENVEAAIEYYTLHLRKFTIDYPEEFGLCHYALAKLFCTNIKWGHEENSEAVGKKIENSLFHCRKACDVFQYDSHPVMWAIIQTYMGSLFRRRTQMTTDRSFLSKRGSAEESIRAGLDCILGAFSVFQNSNTLVVEYAICNLEAGWLYLLQAEIVENCNDGVSNMKSLGVKEDISSANPSSTKEQCISHTERALGLSHGLVNAAKGERPRTWDALDPSTHPTHIKLLLENEPMSHFEGMCLYLIGRAYHDWSACSTIEHYERNMAKVRNMNKFIEKEWQDAVDLKELLGRPLILY